MLVDALKSKANELAPMIHSSEWQGVTTLRRTQAALQFESISMLMEEALHSMQQVMKDFDQKSAEQMMQQVDRSNRVVMALRNQMMSEVGGEFAQELSELCQSIEQVLNRGLEQHRVGAVRMAINIMRQIMMIWNSGFSFYLMEQHSASAAQMGSYEFINDLTPYSTVTPNNGAAVIH
jgi:flagellin-specific chaperone FliS